jgi:hypothetical protein
MEKRIEKYVEAMLVETREGSSKPAHAWPGDANVSFEVERNHLISLPTIYNIEIDDGAKGRLRGCLTITAALGKAYPVETRLVVEYYLTARFKEYPGGSPC